MKNRQSPLAYMAAIALSAASVVGFAAGAHAQERVKVGSLDCVVEGGAGFIIGSSKNLTCSYTPADGGPKEQYAGTVKKFGLDVGVTGKTLIKWIVMAPTANAYSRGALAGDYAGIGAEATVGAGVGANALVGGSNKSFVLQPLSVQAQQGLNLAVGFQSFTLRPLIQ
ncbi:DUF992 domain-containing protein [Afifella sp. IM 167]|uniref:DUF992 domain-containing protein n=1 Tax=Afifella sp. IM 167 TaxID=2033586 RepID=UPI001CCF5DE6|nr:DUF992 domain-containing protein [Afifella sp. IM 167]